MKFSHLEVVYLLSMVESRHLENEAKIKHYESLKLPVGKRDIMYLSMVEAQINITSILFKLRELNASFDVPRT